MEEREPMNDSEQGITDAHREEMLRLVLAEAAGEDVAGALAPYPSEERSRFRRVVVEAGMVKAKGLATRKGETVFEPPTQLSDRGRRRLKELNDRRASGGASQENQAG
jgi:hypothetical protein